MRDGLDEEQGSEYPSSAFSMETTLLREEDDAPDGEIQGETQPLGHLLLFKI